MYLAELADRLDGVLAFIAFIAWLSILVVISSDWPAEPQWKVVKAAIAVIVVCALIWVFFPSKEFFAQYIGA